jgi:hypothetical protein
MVVHPGNYTGTLVHALPIILTTYQWTAVSVRD